MSFSIEAFAKTITDILMVLSRRRCWIIETVRAESSRTNAIELIVGRTVISILVNDLPNGDDTHRSISSCGFQLTIVVIIGQHPIFDSHLTENDHNNYSRNMINCILSNRRPQTPAASKRTLHKKTVLFSSIFLLFFFSLRSVRPSFSFL